MGSELVENLDVSAPPSYEHEDEETQKLLKTMSNTRKTHSPQLASLEKNPISTIVSSWRAQDIGLGGDLHNDTGKLWPMCAALGIDVLGDVKERYFSQKSLPVSKD